MALQQTMMQDYKPTVALSRPRVRWLAWFIAGLGLPLMSFVYILPDVAPGVSDLSGTALITTPLALPAMDSGDLEAALKNGPASSTKTEPAGEITLLKVRRGDSLDRMFRRNHLSISDLAALMQPDLSRKHLRLLMPGDEVAIRHHDGRVLSLSREIDFANSLRVSRSGDEYLAEMVVHEIVPRQIVAGGRIYSSLFEAAAKAGISDQSIMNLAGIFAWDIDFVLDIREGDEFVVIFEELWRNGELVKQGDILAAEFVNQGEVFRALRYVGPEGQIDYFTPQGNNVRKAFVRAPVSFSRISSNFNPRRRHPRLNTIRAHKGVDYAAPSGTPVQAAGDGKVIFRGRKGGYGNAVIIQHGGNITTLYGHLSRFSGKARNGTRVRQGDIIGYVGQTGLATGPHLHYEYRKNGVHMNPRTVTLPAADPINPALREDFVRATRSMLLRLDAKQQILVGLTASNTT